MTVARLLASLGGLALLAAIFWAAARADILASFATISADPWGLVTLIDLYLGFLLMAIVIWALEGQAARALAWIIPLFLLGNFVAALWLIARGAAQLHSVANRAEGRGPYDVNGST